MPPNTPATRSLFIISPPPHPRWFLRTLAPQNRTVFPILLPRFTLEPRSCYKLNYGAAGVTRPPFETYAASPDRHSAIGKSALDWPLAATAALAEDVRNTSYSVWTGVVVLCDQREYVLAVVVFFFSVIFPVVKLFFLAMIWFKKLPDEKRVRLLHWLGILGKWSMLDVFVVAILIVLVKLGPLVKIEPRVGVYFFTAAILSSMLTTMYVERLAKHSLRSR